MRSRPFEFRIDQYTSMSVTPSDVLSLSTLCLQVQSPGSTSQWWSSVGRMETRNWTHTSGIVSTAENLLLSDPVYREVN